MEAGEYELSVEPATEERLKDEDDVVLRFRAEINRTERPYTDIRDKLKIKCEEYLNLMTEVVANCLENFAPQGKG